MPDPQDLVAELRGARTQLAAARLLLSKQLYAPAVTRAYFTMYHAARAALWTKGVPVRTHDELADQFWELFVVTGLVDIRRFKLLVAGRQYREQADAGSVEFTEDRELVAGLVEGAGRFVKSMELLVTAFGPQGTFTLLYEEEWES